MIAATILFNSRPAFWTFLGVGWNPVWRFWIIIAFLNPLFNKMTPYRVMPSFWTCETKQVATSTTWWLCFNVVDFYRVRTVRCWAPLEQAITLDKTIRDEVLVFQFDSWIPEQFHHRFIVNQNVTRRSRTFNHLTGPFIHNFHRKVFCPTTGAIQVSTFQASHHRFR